MRAKQSSTVSEMYCCEAITELQPLDASCCGDGLGSVRQAIPPSLLALPERRGGGPKPPEGPTAIHAEGLLHDARNLMGALGLYCDLLAMPDVLKPEHLHYADEVRLLGTRSHALMERLIGLVDCATGRGGCLGEGPDAKAAMDGPPAWVGARKVRAVAALEAGGAGGKSGTVGRVGKSEGAGKVEETVSLRSVVERCCGLFNGATGGRRVEVSYGEAASAQVSVSAEAVERILVNLVRNAAAALSGQRGDGTDAGVAGAGGDCVCINPVCETVADPTADETAGAIRIGVGLLVHRAGDLRPWPFRRVRLVVEDSGCGMPPEQLERLLCGSRAPSRGNHGIGFRVVRELVAASDGDLRVMSAQGIGTRVQIEWPVAGLSSQQGSEQEEEGHAEDARPQPGRRLRTGAPRLADCSGRVLDGTWGRPSPRVAVEVRWDAQSGVASGGDAALLRRRGDSGNGAGRWM